MPHQDPIVITGAMRTPLGGFQGALSELTAAELGASAIRAALNHSKLEAEQIDEVVMGCVLPAGQGQAPARQAALGAELPLGTNCTTVNKMCGSGMKAAMFAHDLLIAGSATVAIAGGMESMTNAPYLLPKARGGMRMGHGQVLDHMFLDGLEDAYDKGRLMGTFAEDCAGRYSFTREQQDAFAIESLKRACNAIDSGAFENETTECIVKTRKGEVTVDKDEQPHKAKPEKIPGLRPAFAKEGTVTAANSSSISDGAAALVMMRRSEAEKRGLTILATVLGHATHAHEPNWFTTAPVHAMRKLFDKTNLSQSDIDLYEVNEAFAVVTMAATRELDLPGDRVNVNGGACALGHPIGASGARILVTLLHALQNRGMKTGVASLCIGGGEATAMAIELNQ
jgi:acetyl-CoA C-acetyltransferase